MVSQKPKFVRSREWTRRPELRVNNWVCSKESTGGLNETAVVEWLGDIKRTGRSRDSEYRLLLLNNYTAKGSRGMRL